MPGPIAIGENSITLAPPEYVILRKLEYYREGGSEKHLRDIRAMLAISGDLLNRSALQDWITRLDLEVEWQRVTGYFQACQRRLGWRTKEAMAILRRCSGGDERPRDL